MAQFGNIASDPFEVLDDSLLIHIKQSAGIKDNPSVISAILRAIYYKTAVTTKALVKECNLPAPVIARILFELEKYNLISRSEKGSTLTKKGKTLLKNLGADKAQSAFCELCGGKTITLPKKLKPILSALKKHAPMRKKPDVSIDQSYATAESVCLRAAFIDAQGDVAGKNILIIGDDDLTSIPLATLGSAKSITVVDIDESILSTVETLAKKLKLDIKTQQYDVFKKKTIGSFDVFCTDPPYSFDGLEAFLICGARHAPIGYLSYTQKPPDEALLAFSIITQCGFSPTVMLPQFNHYVSGGLWGGQTFFARLIKGKEIPRPKGLYTGEMRQVNRYYVCTKCGREFCIGKGKDFETIQDLKKKSCFCNNKLFTLRRRERVK